jgi:hypothetical protein
MAEDWAASAPAALPFWLRPESILGRLSLTTFIESSHLLAIPSTLALCHLMLAARPSPHGSGLPLARAGYVVGGAYYPPRVRVMGHPVTSRLHA